MKKIILNIIFTIFTLGIFAQDIHFSQYNETPLALNPALTGFFNGAHRFSLSYKNQWSSIGNGFNTYSFSYDACLKGRRKHKDGYLALGGYFYNDVVGDNKLSTLTGQINVAYHLNINQDHRISAGIYGGFGQKSIDAANMQWDSQYDGHSGHDATLPSNETIAYENFGYADFGFGLNWLMNISSRTMTSNDGFRMDAGFSLNHVTQPEYNFLSESIDRMDMRISAHAKALIGLEGTNTSIIPMLLAQFQGPQKEFVPGLRVRYTLREQSRYTGFITEAYLSFACMYRTSDAIVLNGMAEINNLSFGLSYDINVSRLTSVSKGRGGFELTLKYSIDAANRTSRSFF